MAKQGLRPYEVLLFGATGYTGRLCAEYIHAKLPRDLRWAIAGRSRGKLEALSAALLSTDGSRAPPEKCRVVIATVGPYQNHGEPMFQACAKAGTHYVDWFVGPRNQPLQVLISFSTGETPWIRDMITKYHGVAQRSGAIVSWFLMTLLECSQLTFGQMVPSCGFDSIPSDISALAVVDHIRTHLGSHTARVDCSVHEIRGSFSGGTMGSIINAFDLYSLSELFKLFAPFSLSPRQPNRTRPAIRSSFAARVFGLRHVPGLGWMGVNPQGFVDQCYVHRSWGVVADDRAETYGENFDFHAWIRMPGPIRAILWHFAMLTALSLFCLSPARWLVKKMWFKPGDGPAKSFQEQSSFELRTLAIADTPERQGVIGRFRYPGDPYVFTAICLGEAALLLSRDAPVQGRLHGGVLTTARLGSAFVKRLEANGVEISVGEEPLVES
ncbi:hypothetical protein N0V88_003349 [Collariella sp. IMI 366227]|nr:hypothetical protein N0V88_003349 [Collariella sp. IMI 366227]